jgi:hypothetical protein
VVVKFTSPLFAHRVSFWVINVKSSATTNCRKLWGQVISLNEKLIKDEQLFYFRPCIAPLHNEDRNVVVGGGGRRIEGGGINRRWQSFRSHLVI